MSAFLPRASRDGVLILIVIVLGVVCAAGLWRVVLIVPLHVPLDPNEGWNAYHAAAAISGGDLYPGPPHFMITNYPPLFFYIEGLFGRLTQDNIVAGRILSLAALLAISVLIVEIARRMGSAIREGAFAALLLVAHLLLDTDYVGMNDPQLLGHALDLAALLMLLAVPRMTVATVAAAALFVLAGFVKHNLVAMPLATAIWLFVFDWRRGVQFAVAGLVAVLLGLLAFRIAFGSDLLTHLASARTYSLEAAVAAVRDWLVWGFVPAAGLTLLVLMRRDEHIVLVALIALMGFVTGAVAGGAAGVDVNAMFDADIALALGGALLLSRLRVDGFCVPALAALLYAAPLAIGLWLQAAPDWLLSDFWLHPDADDAETANADIAYLRAHPGPALCETLALCYWAGKDAEVDVFNLGEQYATGARSDASLKGLFDKRYFATVQFETLSPFPLTPGIGAALARNYRIDRHDDDGTFFVPRGH